MTVQASGSRHSIGYIAESTYGTTPATPALKALRHNSTTLDLAKNPFQSNELRADRQLVDFRAGTHIANGNVVGELSYSSYDDLFEALLCGTWTSNVLMAGTTRRSFTMERNFADITQYLRYTGMEVDSMQMSMTPGAIVGVTFGFMGQAATQATTIITGATYPAAGTSAAMDALTGTITEGGSAIAIVTQVSFDFKNNMAARYVIGSTGSLEPSIGRSILTGGLTAYFQDATLFNKFLTDNTTSALAVSASDGTNTYTFTVPKLKYTGANVPVANDGPVSITMPWQALLDTVSGTNFQINR